MSGRDAILGRIRRSLQAEGAGPERAATVETRLAEAKPGLIPQRGQVPQPEQVEMFLYMLEKIGVSVDRLESPDAVPGAVAGYLRSRNLPLAIRRGDDARLANMAWAREPAMEVTTGVTHGNDLACLSHAYGAVAETGTLAMVSGPDNPTTLNFLPEHHLVVVTAAEIAGDYEAIWARIRKDYGKGEMPRTVNFITGPSRSGDIEQTIVLGAHGPKALHVMVVG